TAARPARRRAGGGGLGRLRGYRTTRRGLRRCPGARRHRSRRRRGPRRRGRHAAAAVRARRARSGSRHRRQRARSHPGHPAALPPPGPPPPARPRAPRPIAPPTEPPPPHLRRAVMLRDRHCAFPGCDRPPAACHVHHIVPRREGGVTSLTNCVLLCPFHHLI